MSSLKPSKRVQGCFGKFNSCNMESPQIAKIVNGYIIFCESTKGCVDYALGYNEDFTDGVFKTRTDAVNWWNSSKSEYQGKLIGAYH